MKSSPPSINVARLTYLLFCVGAGVAVALSTQGNYYELSLPVGVLGGLAVAAVFIWIETLMRGFSLRGFSTATFGLAVGLFCAWLLTRVQISGVLELAFRDQSEMVHSLQTACDMALYASLGFLGAALALRSNRDDFAFIIPYVRFRQDASSGRPLVVDAKALMDGRLGTIMATGFLRGRLIVPQFVVDDLQELVASSSVVERQSGQCGLEALEKLRSTPDIQVSVHEAQALAEELKPQTRLAELARLLDARILTTDDDLSRFAKLQGVEALNIHELDEALKPQIAVGQRMRLALVRSGKEDGQAVGYLSDGTMVVVNHAASRIGDTVEVVVSSTLQTASGKLVFGELAASKEG